MPLKEGRNPPHDQNPSFSSTLLDKIYRDDDGGGRVANVVPSVPRMRQVCPEGVVTSSSVKEMCMENRVAGGTAVCTERRPRDCDVDHEVAYFSSTSMSSDSSSGVFSSSDTDSFHGAKTKASCFVPLKLRPVKTHAAMAKTEKAENGGGGALFFRNRADCVEPKSKAYETLRKVKQQPVSPGRRITSLLNSIFTSSSKKKGRSHDDAFLERKPKSGQVSTCSSATSFSRVCLNNGYSSRTTVVSLRDEPRNVVGTRSVRFCPVDVVVGEDCPRWPCIRTSRHDESEGVSKSWRGKAKRTWKQEIRRLEDMKSKIEETRKGEDRAELCSHDDEYDDDGAGSCSSLNLFEIDHLAMIDDRHDNKLPVQHTTRVIVISPT